jgi:type VI secretion system protein ImpH
MGPEGGRDPASLRELLIEKTGRFEFLQAVRLFRMIWADREPVGQEADPGREVVRFRSDVSSVFPGRDVQEAASPDADGPGKLTVCFMGVATPASWGALPRRYAEELRYQERNKNPAPRAFFDIFNHRFISLFYRAGEKTRPVLAYESGRQSAFERAFTAILGLGTAGLEGRLELDERMLVSRAGLLAMRPLPALALEEVIRSVFGQPAAIEQFVPERYQVEPDDQNRLGVVNTRLGEDLYLGDEITLVQSKFRVRLGPLTRNAYEGFLPGRHGFRSLMNLVRFGAGDEFDFELQLALRPEDVAPLRVGEPEDGSPRLGWTSWLITDPLEEPPDDAVFDSDNRFAAEISPAGDTRGLAAMEASP